MVLEEKIKKEMALESSLTLQEIEGMWDNLRETGWYLRVKNKIEQQEAITKLKLAIGSAFYESRIVKVIVKLINKLST